MTRENHTVTKEGHPQASEGATSVRKSDQAPNVTDAREGELEPGELRPCPFCGGAAAREDIPEGEGDNAGASYITCKGCWCSTRLEFGRKEGLESAWNSRTALSTPPSQVDAVVEALNEYRRFAGETAGACLGLAMSTDHPAPDEALMDIFHKSQALATKWRAPLAALKAKGAE